MDFKSSSPAGRLVELGATQKGKFDVKNFSVINFLITKLDWRVKKRSRRKIVANSFLINNSFD
jgi:hypothetical protein